MTGMQATSARQVPITAALRAAVRTQHKHPVLEISPSHRDGDFTSLGVDCPFVFRSGGRTGMTFVGWDGIGYQSGLSWRDGSGAWSDPVLVLARDPHSAHRRYNAALTSLLRDVELSGEGELIQVDGWYYGTYHAYPDRGYEEGSAIIGVVRSRDLVHWEEHGDVLRPEDGAGWERGGLYKSWLMRAEGRYWLFYNAKDRPDRGWIEQTGAAVSDDLVTWTRLPGPLLPVGREGAFDERFASDPCVLRHEDGWVMFYFGLSADGVARESYAVSDDLLSWRKSDEILVDVGAPGSIDATYAHKPSVITRDGRLEHYYCAVAPLPQPIVVGGHALTEMRGIAVARS